MLKIIDKIKKKNELRKAIVLFNNLANLQANNQNKKPFLDKVLSLQFELAKLENSK